MSEIGLNYLDDDEADMEVNSDDGDEEYITPNKVSRLNIN